ncbi:MAG TPA: efflux RND transporter periplasmic adaptor subunit [Bryobacteraceae bacterium]|nr:efflux RND transporter periplasmic adaptor subunit [Bryobacteraceae bacterium]
MTTKSNEELLRSEIEDLKRQLAEQKNPAAGGRDREPAGPSGRTLAVLAMLVIALVVAGFFMGYLPRQRREQVLAAESKAESQDLPVVNVARVTRSGLKTSLVLPGNIQAVTEGPVLARATGYIRKRYVDIGDRVKEGQVLAEIEAPELDQQIKQAQAAIDQANSSVQQAEAAVQQARSNENLARVTAERWANLLKRGVVSRQDNDTAQMQYEAQQSNVQALEKAVAAGRSNSSAAQANLARLNQLQEYLTVRAPFAGVITVRNVDSGVLVNEGNTLLFRIAQTDRLRTYLNVPQVDAQAVRVGQAAFLTIPDLPGRKFNGTVARTANALDPATRTLLVEVQVPNSTGALMPGEYAQVDLSVPRSDPPLLIPGDTLVVRSDGPQVAVVNPDGTVHFKLIQLGRDFGDRLEVLSGLEEGQQVAVNPSDAIREGVTVKPATAAKRP